MAQGDSYAVIGGEGFVGHALVEALSKRYPGSQIVSLDVVQRHYPEKGQWEFRACDLTDEASLTSALEGVKTGVLHTASPHIGGTKEVCERVNVDGTRNIINVCKRLSIKRLVYTSSAGIPFDGRDLINVDERCTPAPKILDPYNDTKARAEALVLEANGQEGLLTCAIRPAGIFGAGDRQNIPGFLGALKKGKTKFTIGGCENVFDLTHIDNVVHAHLLALERLEASVPISPLNDRLKPVKGSLPKRKLPTSMTAPLSDQDEKDQITASGVVDPPLPASRNRFDQFFDIQHVAPHDIENSRLPVAGQAFFITNGEPIPFWSWAKALWYEYNGHETKTINLPADIGFAHARIENVIAWLRGKEPGLPIAAVQYSTSKRYYNIEKARQVLGYEPVVTLDAGMRDAVRWYKAHEAEIEAQQAQMKAVKA